MRSFSEAGVFPVQVDVDGQELIICNLSNQCLHMSVDLFFDKGTKLTFMTTGKAIIHLSGTHTFNIVFVYVPEESKH